MPPAVRSKLQQLLDKASFQFANTQPQNPHYYTLKTKWADPRAFEWCVETIWTYGYNERFRGHMYRMFILDEYRYWTMGYPVEGTKLINRKKIDQT